MARDGRAPIALEKSRDEVANVHPLGMILMRNLRIDAAQMVEEGHGLAAINAEIDAAAATGSLDALARRMFSVSTNNVRYHQAR